MNIEINSGLGVLLSVFSLYYQFGWRVTMQTKFRLGIYLSISIGLWFYVRGCDKKIDSRVSSPTLNPGIKEKLVINPRQHTISVVSPSGTKRLFLPERPSSVELTDQGTLKITDRAYGTEISPTLGFAYSDGARLAIGVSFGYWDRWEIGVAVYPTVSGKFTIKFGPVVSYNVFANTNLFVGVVDGLAPIGGICLKF